MTRILIVAPTPALRAGLRAMLERVDIEVISEATRVDGLAVSVFPGAQPDVVVLADESELNRLPQLLRQDSTQAVVVLTDREAVAAQLRGMSLRGWGIAPNDSSSEALQSIVLAVAQGLVVLPTRLAHQVIPLRPAEDPSIEPIELTPRERDVLEWLSRGLPNKLIALELGITEATVKFHVSAVYVKLNVASRAEAVSKAARIGLITL